MNIQYEKDVIDFLNIPSIPKKEFDGKTSFKDGVAVLQVHGDEKAYAVATFDSERDTKPRIKKVFGLESYSAIEKIYVVPSYMDENVSSFDMDEESKKAAQRLIDEAHELENEGVEEPEITMPSNEYFFDSIHSDEEAVAWLRAYNKANKVRGGKIPTDHETIIMRLSVIWAEMENKNKK